MPDGERPRLPAMNQISVAACHSGAAPSKAVVVYRAGRADGAAPNAFSGRSHLSLRVILLKEEMCAIR